jgi:GNAT superfamily N-acetyltransferase
VDKMGKLKAKLRQYGYRNSLIRGVKSILRRSGITFEKFLVLKRDLDRKLIPIEPKIEISVKQLNFRDFDNADHFGFSEDSLDLFKRRFDRNGYIALGAFDKGRLIYFCWLSSDNFESSVNLSDRVLLDKDEALLLNAFTHPDYRGLGIHTYMNAIRLNRLIDIGKKRAVVLVLFENIPARRSQARVGFDAEYLVYYRKIFKKLFIKRKDVNFRKSYGDKDI